MRPEQAARACEHEVQQLDALRREIQREHDDFLSRAEEQGAERAAAAREGRHGPAAQELQGRLDRAETTPAAIRNGTDRHSSAVAARGRWEGLVTAWAEEPGVQSLRR